MRCSGWSSLAISVCSALALAAPAAAHVAVTPPFLAAGSSDSVELSVPNERDEPMTGFSLTVPSGFEIVQAHPADGWDRTFSDSTATWTAGALSSGASATYSVELKTPAVPAVVELEAVQRYDDGAVVRWPVAFTVTPADESSSQSLALAAVVGLLGVLVVAAIAAVAWRRRRRSLQER